MFAVPGALATVGTDHVMGSFIFLMAVKANQFLGNLLNCHLLFL